MIDLLIRLIRKLGIQTIFTLALLLGAFSTLALALSNLVRGFELGLALMIVTLGIAFGWSLAKSRLPGSVASIIALMIGSEIVLVRVGQLGGKLAMFARASADFVWQVLLWLREARVEFQPRDLPNAQPTLNALRELIAALGTLFARTRDWLSAVASGIPAFDPVAVAITWSFIVWCCAVWAAWSIRRRGKTFDAFLPAIVLLATMLAYTGADSMYLAPLLGATLLLMPLTSQRARERLWKRAGIGIAEDLTQDVALLTIPLAAGLLLLASIIPSISIQQIVRAAQERIEEQTREVPRWADSSGVIPQPTQKTIFDQVRAPGLPRRHLLGAGQELSEQLAMLVSTGEIISDEGTPPRYYWRGSTYDRYTGRGWMTSATEIADYRAGEFAITEIHRAHRVVTQTVEWLGAPGLMYATGTLVTANQDYRVAWRSPEDAFSISAQTTNYRVESLLPVVGEKELRASGANYPTWVRERYLALPDDVPERVLTRARDLTATAPTPYERARVLETYLRKFPYTLDLPAPPPNRDVVDYFLFDAQRGYCDYYATALVVLARAAGLPARLVVGYAAGSYDHATGRFVVVEADAHSWVEIYFPEYSWIEFEPTASRAQIERPEEALPIETRETDDRRRTTDARWRMFGASGWGMIALGILGLPILGLAILGVDLLRLRWLAPPRAIETIFRRLARAARWLGLPARASHTPNEIGALLREHFAGLSRARRALWQNADTRIAALTALYVQVSYSPRTPDARDRANALIAWRALQGQLWLAWVWQIARRK
ncbi:MAG: transglutaminase domain-containing protein [Chloroflexi bacterium]|nr:transglutaminase domain-containing protein [Chloroflexota bacterium]